MRIFQRIYHSIVRRDSLTTSKGKAELFFNNLWLHIHPVKVHKERLKLKHTWYLGFVAFYLFIILIITGIALMFYYHPSPERAYQDMKDLQFVVYLGVFLRNMHRWAAHGMVAVVFLHMCRVFYTASYKEPRQFNWVIGVVLLMLTLGLSFTGYLLPWDQLAFWAITVGTTMASYAPVVGGVIKTLLLGGSQVGGAALLRFYVLHVVVLPFFAVVFIMIHFWRIRKDGGLSTPLWELRDKKEQAKPMKPDPDKTYGLMEVVDDVPIFEVAEPGEEEDLEFSYPYALFRHLIAFLLTTFVIMLASLLWNAPLEEMANPSKTPNPAKAPWYFLGLQELVSHSALIGGVVIPAATILILFLLPYLDKSPERRPKKRKMAIIAFTVFVVANITLIIIGKFFRGHGWSFILPWQS